ncbi:MAG: Zn-ribbon domain-containing OB-fold protein [Planctomycetes bacterium]|nr:Zn-ribbon domain-containing OB-fold protein [Planctomycetota bacterium]
MRKKKKGKAKKKVRSKNKKAKSPRRKKTAKPQKKQLPVRKLKAGKEKVYPSQGLSHEDLAERKVCLTDWHPDLKYKWDAGVAISRYLNGLKKGVLLGRRCRHCSRVLVPPRMFCEWCFQPTSEWIKLADTGTVNTFSVSYVAWNMVRLKEPQVPAVIEIDGASKGVGIMHLLGEIDPKKIKIGIRVKAVWKPPEERQGAITDIKYFKPI